MNTAKIVAYSQVAPNALDDLELQTVQELIAYFARVSNPSNQNNVQTSEKLITYLLNHKHFSPFEMVHATLELNTTRDIARQIIRHRSFAFQEFSQRYANPEALGTDLIFREARMQDPKNRQNSIVCTDPELAQQWLLKQETVQNICNDVYNWAIERGIAKEQARVVLPEGLTKSRLLVAGSLRSFIHYIQVRTEEGVQAEHRELARAIAVEIAKIFPLAMNFVQ